MLWALLPLKDFTDAKQRLSGVLSPHERRHLFHLMVEDVLDVLANHELIDKTVIVSDEPAAKLLAEHYAVEFWPEQSLAVKGLNGTVTAVARRLQQQGVDSLLVVHGDLPLISSQQITDLIAAQASAPGVTVVADRHHLGTNCMLCSPPAVIDFHYGDNSYHKHRQASQNAGVNFSEIALDGIACDIDNPEDLMVLLARAATGKKSIGYLQEMGIADRLRSMSIGHADAGSEVERDGTQ